MYYLNLAEAGTRRRRRGMERREERDRPLPPLLARVGGNIEVTSIYTQFFKKIYIKKWFRVLKVLQNYFVAPRG